MTEAELTFVKRMLPYIETGKSFDDAAQAVLDDDQRLFKMCGIYEYASQRTDEQKAIRSTICNLIYSKLRENQNV